MKLLPLYADPRLSIEKDTPLPLNSECTRCTAGGSARNVCIGAEAVNFDPDKGGGIYFVGEAPDHLEDRRGRPFMGRAGTYLRAEVRKHYTGPMILDNAMKCAGGRFPNADHILACRPYLLQTLREAKPDRVVVLGRGACVAVFGSTVPIQSARRGHAWLYNDGANPIPVVLLGHPGAALSNRFVRAQFEEDLEWALTSEPPAPPLWDKSAHIIESLDDALDAEEDLSLADWVTFDCETVGKLFNDDFQVIALSAVAKGSNVPYVWDAAALKDERGDALKRVLSNPKIPKGGQYVKYDMLSANCGLGVDVKNIAYDTRLLRKLIDGEADASLAVMAHLVGLGGHKEEAKAAIEAGLKEVRRRLRAETKKKPTAKDEAELGTPLLPWLDPSIEAAIRKGNDPKEYKYSFMPDNILLRYVALDAVTTDRLAIRLNEEIDTECPELRYAADTVIKPVSAALERVESWGMAVSIDAIKNVSAFAQSKLVEIDRRLSPYNINPGSTKDLRKLLFQTLGLPVIKKTPKGEPSTDKAVLNILADRHPVVGDILMHRKYAKLDGTYATGLQRHIRSDGRIHPNLKPDGARSGRWSCTDPNLQNLPSEKDAEGRLLRDCFVAEPGKLIVSADYSQVELRVAAMLSGDKRMIDIFKSGQDYHLRTAQMISQMVWGIAPGDLIGADGEPTKQGAACRRQSKAFNFGLLYGMGDETLAANLGGTAEEAAKVRRGIMGQFNVLDAWIKDCIRETHRTGYTWTYWQGQRCRRRPLFDIASSDGGKQSTASNGSYNTPVQGSAGEYNNMSLIELVHWVLDDLVPARVIMAVHDCILIECDEDVVDEVVFMMRQIMTQWGSGGVPLEVDIEVGRSWGSLEKDPAKWNSL